MSIVIWIFLHICKSHEENNVEEITTDSSTEFIIFISANISSRTSCLVCWTSSLASSNFTHLVRLKWLMCAPVRFMNTELSAARILFFCHNVNHGTKIALTHAGSSSLVSALLALSSMMLPLSLLQWVGCNCQVFVFVLISDWFCFHSLFLFFFMSFTVSPISWFNFYL